MSEKVGEVNKERNIAFLLRCSAVELIQRSNLQSLFFFLFHF